MKTIKLIYTFAFCLFTFVFLFTTTFAQEAKRTTKELETKVQQRDSKKGTDGTTSVGDKIKIIGTSSAVILEIEEETNGAASIIINDKNNSGNNKKLLNEDGNLMWGTEQLATGSGSGGTTYAIGDFAQGGIVFWVDETAQHGLVCTKEEQNGGSRIRWGAGTYTHTMAKGNGPLSGEMNTTIIIANQGIGDGTTYAARVCSELEVTEGGKTYGDWYLPSKQELNLMYINKASIKTTAQANSGLDFQDNYYWSSTEENTVLAWLQFFTNGSRFSSNKAGLRYVRAVRAF
ncbi:MAG: DUF1566 domain-containing protein [Melioribacteraceae bacterium]